MVIITVIKSILYFVLFDFTSTVVHYTFDVQSGTLGFAFPRYFTDMTISTEIHTM